MEILGLNFLSSSLFSVMKPPKKICFGVLGCSRIAKRSVIPALIDSSLANLQMIGSRSVERARECAEQYGCGYGSYEEVLGNRDVNAVYISLPNSLHEEWAIRAAEAGKHIWCEKPAALTYKSAKGMIETAQKNNVRLMEGFMFLSHPQHAKVVELVRQGALGELLNFEGCFAVPMPEREANILNKKLGGGSYNDAAVYPIRASRMIFGEEPVSVACSLVMDKKTGVDVKADMFLMYPGGRSAFISSVFGSYFQSTYSMLGTKGRVQMGRAYAAPPDRTVKIFLEREDRVEEISIEPANHFKLMMEDFCREILLGSKSKKNYEQDLLAQARVLDAGRLSHKERRVVYLSEIAA